VRSTCDGVSKGTSGIPGTLHETVPFAAFQRTTVSVVYPPITGE
jgi:hypothetical protein